MNHFFTRLPVKFSVDTAPPFVLAGAWIDVDTAMGQAVAIERIRIIDEGKVALCG